ncbi:LuxR C-terminal-related transcriptional regulator [Nocardia sp. NPDC051911]|uniref:helix-turn-helix transcriptional regulator n=1 Tax=Nocardia sp. NPDC051911 TaxID=3154648 RepID=UPI0034498E0F
MVSPVYTSPAHCPEHFVDLRHVIAGPLPEIAQRFSQLIGDRWEHSALVIFTRECTGRPRKVSGAAEIVDRVTIDELDALNQTLALGATFDGVAVVAGDRRPVWAVRDTGDTLLLLAPRFPGERLRSGADLAAIFGIVATSIEQQVVQASPAYLADSRAASVERARTITELTVAHETALTSVLTTLRSNDLDDRRARIIATETITTALVALRAAGEADRALTEEAVTTAFARLQGELKPLLRDIPVEYVEPPVDARPVPGEIAHAARAMVRAIALAFIAQPFLSRLRVGWTCDGANLIVEVRDQGCGAVDENTLSRQLSGRIEILRGGLDIEIIPDWGSRVTIVIPLDPPPVRDHDSELATLNQREIEVLGHLVAGNRNKTIASQLRISESTVKFHVAAILKKLNVTTRGEAVAIAARAGVRATA